MAIVKKKNNNKTVAKKATPAKKAVAKKEVTPAKKTVAKKEVTPAKKTVTSKKATPAKKSVAKKATFKRGENPIQSSQQCDRFQFTKRFKANLINAGVLPADVSDNTVNQIKKVYGKTLKEVLSVTSYMDSELKTTYRRVITKAKVTTPPNARGGLSTLMLDRPEIHFNMAGADYLEEKVKFFGYRDEKDPNKFIVCEYEDPDDTSNPNYSETGEVIDIEDAAIERNNYFASMVLDPVIIEETVEEPEEPKKAKKSKKKVEDIEEEDEDDEDIEEEDEDIEEEDEDIEDDEEDEDDEDIEEDDDEDEDEDDDDDIFDDDDDDDDDIFDD